jgi:UDP-N-acetylmuramoyl-L-alanyl-D-glutamate--2,6-diaminopimelate ligase
MKSEELISKIQPFIQSGNATYLTAVKVLEWRLEESSAETAVAYQLNEDSDSNNKLAERLKKFKPAVLILSRQPLLDTGVPTIIIKNGAWSQFLYELCQFFYPHPNRLKILAITGTNGKTTTADLALQLGEQAGLKGFSIGTLGVRQNGKTLEEFGLTTPGQIQLHQLIHKYGMNSDFLVMEASSHALHQERVFGLEFVSAAWTSFTQDHLDYHKSMDEYFAAKCLIVRSIESNGSLYIPEGQFELREKLKNITSFKLAKPLTVSERKQLSLFFKTKFNEENLLCALALIESLGVSRERLNLAALNPPPGRFYIREWSGKTAVVDFAHTPDALENIMRAIRETFPTKELVVLFGCGGDRDRKKRPLMGQAVEKWAHKIIITSDNPRTEDPVQIMQDIMTGIADKSKVSQQVERPIAVMEALETLNINQVLLLAGKGHEDYILKGTTKVAYSDIDELDKFVIKQQGIGHD